MKGYSQFCPVAKAAEVFAERWTPLILRELCYGPKRFSELQAGVPLMSRTLLATRLRELSDAEIVALQPKEKGRGHVYRLTPAGEAFRPVIELMGGWGQHWAQGRIEPGDLDAELLVWGMRRQIDPSELPSCSFVVRFEFSGLPKRQRNRRYWWLVLRPDDIEVCLKDPGLPADVVVAADLAAFTRVWMGYQGLAEALASGSVAFTGPPRGIAALRRILRLSDRPTVRKFTFQAWSATA
ncbi:MAG: transcriptional regulator [Alphaproteobacteria bacterium]|nr:MAG: transcriptional regulator [Alphaproteobacteria bacterium]